MYELHFAVPMASAILNTINVRLDARMVSILLLHSESKLIFVDCLSRSLINEALAFFPPHVQPPLLILITDNEVPSTPSSSAVHFYDTYEGVVEKGDPEFKWVRPGQRVGPHGTELHIRYNLLSQRCCALPPGIIPCSS
jgi:hypothetical protein